MSYVENPIPADVQAWKVKLAERLRTQLIDQTYEERGVLYWKAHHVPVPAFVFADAFCTPSAAQVAAQ